MKKILYYLPIILLVIYLILFPVLQNKLCVTTTPNGRDYGDALDETYGMGKYHIEGISYDPMNSPTMVVHHSEFQCITAGIIFISIILKVILNKKRLKIENKTNIIIFIVLIIIITVLTIYTTILNPTFIMTHF